MEINITWYNDALRQQVIDLFATEYGLEPDAFNRLFERFYFHPFQKNKCLLVVAMDGETVAGFQSFFYWPYTFNGRTYNSFQSGNSLVNPDYRGKGIFNKMLAFIDKENKTADIDFLMGFPVEASLKNFLKDKWQNIFNLRWYIKFCNPFSFFTFKGGKDFVEGCIHFNKDSEPDVIRLLNHKDLTDWRNTYLTGRYFSFRYKNEGDEIIFHLKPNKRKKILNELIIGNILFSNEGAKKHLADALKQLNARVFKTYGAHFLSAAINEESSFDLKNILVNAGFKRSGKTIYFIAKPFKNNDLVLKPANWVLHRSDIDTW